MSTRGAIKIREKGEELRIFYGHDAMPRTLGHQLRRYLNMTDHKWSAIRIYNDLCNGKCFRGSYGNMSPDYDFEPVNEFGLYEEYGYLIDCDEKRLTCYDLPGIPASIEFPDCNTNEDDWSGREKIEIPYRMVSEEETSQRIKFAVGEYLFSREVPKEFDIFCKLENGWSVHICVENDCEEKS